MRNECAFFWVLKRKSSFYTEFKPKANKQVNLIFLSVFFKEKELSLILTNHSVFQIYFPFYEK